MFRSVCTLSRLYSNSRPPVSRFLLLHCDTAPKTATLGCVSSSHLRSSPSDPIGNKTYSLVLHKEESAMNSVVKIFTVSTMPRPFQPWQISMHHQCSASGFAISGRNVHGVANPKTVEKKVEEKKKVKKPKGPPKKPKAKKVKRVVETKGVRFCKQHQGKLKGVSSGENRLSFGNYALQTLESAWISSRQIEAGRRVMAPTIRRGGKIWVRIFPDKPVTKRPTEMRMGGGKGPPTLWVAMVKRGKILYEMTGVSESIAREAISKAASKLSMKTKFVVS